MKYVIYKDVEGNVLAQYGNCDTPDPPLDSVRIEQDEPAITPQAHSPRERLDDRIRRIAREELLRLNDGLGGL